MNRHKASDSPLRILGIFTGQGAQWPTMSKSLLQQNSIYRDTIRKLDKVLQTRFKSCEWTLEGQIMASDLDSRIQESAVSQPVCTAVQIALVDFVRSIGIDFHTVVGHSSGEIAAAYAAGRISAEDAIKISYVRGNVAHRARGRDGQKGGMLAARMSEAEALDLYSDHLFAGRLDIAASNSPNSTTLSGDTDAIDQAHEQLKASGKVSQRLQVKTAYHSYHMKAPGIDYSADVKALDIVPNPKGNGIIWISSVKGLPRTEAKELEFKYWEDNMVSQVEFTQAIEYALSQSSDLFDCAIEIGPHPALQSPVSETAKSLGRTIPYTSPLVRKKDDGLSVSKFLEFMWYNFGPLKINLHSYIEQSPIPDLIHSRLSNAPPYPFDHSVGYWRESRIARQFQFRTDAPHELLGIRSRDDNMYEMKWRNILKTEKIQWLEHHSFQGQALLPASAYCVMALDAARYFLAGRPASLIELRDIEIFSGIAIDRGSAGVETLFTLNMSTDDKDSLTIDGIFALYSCPADGTVKMKKDASGLLHIVLGQPSWGILPPRQAPLSETTAADPEAFYEMMNETGLTYTGPFKAIATIQRRYRYCCATVRRFHPDDTTKLGISPATLDACFQSAFLTYTFPDDGSLWTSFLPTGIRRIKFNLAALENNVEVEPHGMLTADTHLVRATPPVEAARASIAVDSAIFNKAGYAEIHIEDLVVRALSNTSPNDDQELYLHTVMDVDPIDEIVQVDDAVSDDDGVQLAESCLRIASFVTADYVGDDTSVTQDGSTTDTQEAIDIMIQNSYHADYLASIKDAGQLNPNRLSEELTAVTGEARQVSIFRNHVGRIVKQIAHRYPWMIILYTPTEQLRLTRLILKALGDSFKSFKIGVSQENSFSESQHTEVRSAQGLIKEIDINTLGQPEHQLGPDNRLDLMILPTTILDDKDKMKALTNLGGAMKPGGFLILIDLNPTIFGTQSRKHSDDSFGQPPTPPPWPDVLDAYGFTRQARNSDIYHAAGSVFVRQFGESKSFKIPPKIMGSTTIAGRLLLVRGVSGEGSRQLVASLQDRLSPCCGEIMCRSLENATTQELESCDAIIMLADLDEPVMSNMTQHRINQLNTLLRPALTVLWVTCDARSGNPEHAASFGFVRTMAAEMPTLKLQVLDLDPNDSDSPTDQISSAFYQLACTSKENGHTMWTLEPEIHMENGRRLIPRVMSWKHGNDRVNALHRIVTTPVNTIQHCVELVPEVLPNGNVRFGLKSHPREEGRPGKVTIQVEYSVALPFNLHSDLSGYVCVGREHTTGEQMAALTSTNSSYISCLPSQAIPLGKNKWLSLVVLYKFIRRITAPKTISIAPYEGPIVLIDPDVEFARQLVYIAPKCRRVIIFGTCCNQEDKARHAKMTECDQLRLHVSGCLHPQSLLGDLRQAFPPRGIIFNFLPQGHVLSKRIKELIPSGCTMYTGFATFVLEAFARKEDQTITNTVWASAMNAVLRQTPDDSRIQTTAISTVSLSDIQSHASGMEPFQIVDWRRNSSTLQTINHTIEEPLVFPDKTYYLFGMTGDFGHSLCRLFLERGARNIVLASRNPNASLNWVAELNRTYAADIRIEKADVTNIESLRALKDRTAETMPPPGGVVNGAMVLDDRSFAQMTIESWDRVMRPKTIGSANLDVVFEDPGLDFFIMTSSFAAIGGHAGQSNYAAANMYMNGLAAQRRARGLRGTALNIGVIYGLGFLNREKSHLYAGLEREGYPPISEHNLHHMFLEAIVAGRPDSKMLQQNPFDITTGLLRFRRGSPRPLHWHEDLRFGHFALRSEWDIGAADTGNKKKKSLREEIAVLSQKEAIADTIGLALEQMLRTLMQFPEDASIDMNSSLMDLGLDSLTAVEVRNWFNKSLDKDFPNTLVL
ncbi:acyl transferase domain-containing protein [Xylaria arbuscula]|nr:acyl transferase domain-containing protein [Xylaria arbuscula]